MMTNTAEPVRWRQAARPGLTDAEDLGWGVSEKVIGMDKGQTSLAMTKAPTKTRAMDARNTIVARSRTGLNIFTGKR